MQNIFLELIKIDNNAKEEMAKSIVDKNILFDLSETKKTEILFKIRKEQEIELNKQKENYKEEINKKIDGIEKETNNKIKLIKMEFEANQDKWEQELFNKIIGR